MTKELAKTLTTALVQFIDRERQEGSMCCSSYECEKIEKAFESGTYDVVEKLIQRKLTGLTEFELFLFNAILDNSFVGAKGSENALEMVKKIAPELLALAKKQLLCYADESNPARAEWALEKIREYVDEQLTILDKQTLLHPDDEVFWGQRNAYKQMKDKLNSL